MLHVFIQHPTWKGACSKQVMCEPILTIIQLGGELARNGSCMGDQADIVCIHAAFRLCVRQSQAECASAKVC